MKKRFNKYDIEAFFSIVRLGINHTSYPLSLNHNWTVIQALANEQGLSAIVLDGIEKLSIEKRPSKSFVLPWIGDVLQSFEQRYEQYCRAIAELTAIYKSHGVKMMVLKGYACSLDWPKPEHRPCGDIDIWLFGKQKKADDILGSWFKVHGAGVRIDNSHHHHTVFNWKGFTVENHYDFVNVHAHKSSAGLEKIFKELGTDDSHFVDVNDVRVYLPSPNLHALFLIKHMVSHFAAAEITLRQVLDWAFFVEKHTKEIDWEWLTDVLEDYHMMDFFNIMNAICVDDLGFDAEIFPTIQFLPALKERVLEDILAPAYGAAEPKDFFPRLIYKYKRWQGNAWKQKLCYSESRWEMFWYGVWNHLLKPASI